MNSLRSLLFVLALAGASLAFAGSAANSSSLAIATAGPASVEQEQQWRIEGEKRYRTNCGRCHQPPHKFPPRVMAMAIRHMRVRATLTDDDMRYVLYYMTH